MSSSAAYFIQVKKSGTIKSILGKDWEVVSDPGYPFVMVDGPFYFDDGPRADEELMSRISKQLDTDVIWLAVQSSVDAFQYLHYRAGSSVRTLVAGCKKEGCWEKIEGDPEPWEAWRKPPQAGGAASFDAQDVSIRIATHYGFSGTGVPFGPKASAKKRK